MSNLEKVYAQSTPTLKYEGPFEDDQEPVPTGDVTIRLTSAISALEVGEDGTVDIRVETVDNEIKNYTVTVTFNPDVLEVVDSDMIQTGIQINFIDSFSTATSNTVNNSTGVVTIGARISGSATQVNRKVAEIKFKAKQSGTSIISIDKTRSTILNE